jgi:Polyketide cyclase / dehydrase and lipid transport
VALAAVIAAIVFGGAHGLPDVLRVERHVTIAAPPERIAPAVFELKNYPGWLSWKEIDVAAGFTFSGAEAGVGQKMGWTSANPKLGEGAMESTAASPQAIDLKLEGGIFRGATMRLALAPVDGGTGVTWTVTMPNDGIHERWRRYFTFEGNLAPALVKSLANLKDQMEQRP